MLLIKTCWSSFGVPRVLLHQLAFVTAWPWVRPRPHQLARLFRLSCGQLSHLKAEHMLTFGSTYLHMVGSLGSLGAPRWVPLASKLRTS